MTTSRRRQPSKAAAPHLLDANLLIALVVPTHVHHARAERWSSALEGGFATCPITQGALVRFLVREGASGLEAQRFLHSLIEDGRHRGLDDDVDFSMVDLTMVVGHRQVTDAYLAGLARHHRCRLATLDRGLAAVHPDVAVLVPE